jgi:hypothetical protein
MPGRKKWWQGPFTEAEVVAYSAGIAEAFTLDPQDEQEKQAYFASGQAERDETRIMANAVKEAA